MEAALLARARELLDDLPKWRLPHAAWSRPAAVEALAAAYDTGNGLALQVADVPPPEPLQEQVTALVHMIAESGESTRGEGDGDEGR